MNAFLTLFFGLLITTVCNSQNYKPDNLRRLDDKERLEFAEQNNFPTSETVFKDANGKVIGNRSSLDITEIFYDYYVNSDNKIIECIVRPITNKDRELWKQIIDVHQNRDWGTITPIQTECDKQVEVLSEVLVKDQQNRNSGQAIDLKIDKENLEKVLGIIENCGFPTLITVGQKGMTATFLVLQHSTRKVREKYLTQIKLSAEKGDLSLQEVALMEDRLLMESGEKQKYGTQVTSDLVNGGWKLYPLEDIKNVNERRRTMGLGPLEDYVKRWNITLRIE